MIGYTEANEVFEWWSPVTEEQVNDLYARRSEPGQSYYLGKFGEEPLLWHRTAER